MKDCLRQGNLTVPRGAHGRALFHVIAAQAGTHAALALVAE